MYHIHRHTHTQKYLKKNPKTEEIDKENGEHTYRGTSKASLAPSLAVARRSSGGTSNEPDLACVLLQLQEREMDDRELGRAR